MLKQIVTISLCALIYSACGARNSAEAPSYIKDSRVGNGGEFDIEQPWTRIALDLRHALEALPLEKRRGYDPARFWDAVKKTTLRVEDDIHVIQPDGTSAKKDARLEITEKGVFLAIDPDWFRGASIEQVMGAQLHEYGQVMELESDTYEESATVLKEVINIYWQSNSTEPVLLHEVAYDSYRQGISWREALRLCQSYKEMFQEKYFLTYCQFNEKSWNDIRYGTTFYRGYQFLGFETYVVQDRIAMRGFYVSESFRSGTRPIWAVVDVPYTFQYQVPQVIYGLRVYGIGRMGPEVPEKTVLSSEDLDGSGVLSLTYDSKIKALLACKRSMLAAGSGLENFKYYRARCTVDPAGQEEGRFVFKIKSKNPFLP